MLLPSRLAATALFLSLLASAPALDSPLRSGSKDRLLGGAGAADATRAAPLFLILATRLTPQIACGGQRGDEPAGSDPRGLTLFAE